MLSVRIARLAIIALLVSAPVAHAETPAQRWHRMTSELDFLGTHDGFLYWFGAMAYQSQACAAPLPEAAIDALARRAGVGKAEVAKEGPGSPFAEGYQDAILSAKREGLDTACAKYRAHIEEMREKGLL